MPPTITKSSRIYLAIWRKAALAHSAGDVGLTINFNSTAECIAFSRSMYRALLPYRKMRLHDEVLSEAVETLAVWSPKIFPNGVKPYVKIQKRKDLDMAEGLFNELGMTEEDLLTEGERGAMASAAAVDQSLSNLEDFMRPPERKVKPDSSTPFYTRD